MRITLDINGNVIGRVGVHLTDETDDTGKVKYDIYDIRGHEEDSKERLSDYPHIGEAWHHRDRGAATLASIVLDEIGDEYLD